MYKDQPFSIYIIYLFYALQISVKLGSKLGQKLTTFSYFMSSCTNRNEVLNNFFSLICSQPRDKQNCARDLILSEYF